MDREDQRFRVLGRAAGSNDAGRNARHARVAEDDGWAREEVLPVLRTNTSIEVPRRVITYNRSPDLPFDRSINPYRVANMAVFTVSHGPATPILDCRRGWILKRR